MTRISHPTPRFIKPDADTCCFRELKQRVYQAHKTLPKRRRLYVKLKAFLLPLLYFGFYALALQTGNFRDFLLLYMLQGVIILVLFLNLIHEACHHTLFRSKKANTCYLLLFDLIGANSYMWQKRHVRLHHNYPNVQGWDADIEKCDYLKVHPNDASKYGLRHQHLLVLLYPLFITNWFLIRDFKDYFNSDMIVRKLGPPPLLEYVKLFAGKLLFLGYMVVLPAMVTSFSWLQVAFAFFMLLVTAGFFALVVLLPPHVNTGNQFYQPDHTQTLRQSWFMHQLQTTNDVTTNNWLYKHVLANCHCHLAHHLFPEISYVYAPEVTAVIRNFCIEKGLSYRSYSLFTAFRKHYELIRHNEMAFDMLNEDM